MLNKILLALAIFSALTGCLENDTDTIDKEVRPWVKTVTIKEGSGSILSVTGTVRARHETPVASLVGGRILARHVDAGQHVQAGQNLFSIDPRDLDDAERVAEALLTAAEAELDTATRELDRQRQLVAKNFTSQQAIERFILAKRDAASGRAAALARLSQARNSRKYAEIKAEANGVLIEVNGQPGQVVSTGQELALLAHDGNREIELYLPSASHPPLTGRLISNDGSNLKIELREVAGAADLLSRSWRARYRVLDLDANLPLGIALRVELAVEHKRLKTLTVPLAALDERGEGPVVWIINEGRVKPVPVMVITLGPENAEITTNLLPNSYVIGLGTHLLTPGMAVRVIE
ncbi:MAG: efflux RND transporter periplasmic adaptor subunit [Gammaproteobacteria bacterium]|nr:MAG: efflux RND transporter periplasmic adaptor subunit [Gammaproteobacteria bacterium]